MTDLEHLTSMHRGANKWTSVREGLEKISFVTLLGEGGGDLAPTKNL